MKKTKLILLGVITFLLAIAFACSKSDDDSSGSATVTTLVSSSAVFLQQLPSMLLIQEQLRFLTQAVTAWPIQQEQLLLQQVLPD